MNHKQYKYNHIGIPTTKKLKNEQYWPDFDIYTSGYQENEFNIEWMRYGKKCKLPAIVKKMPHVAFEVNDISRAIKGHKILIKPNSPCEGVMVAFVLVNGAPIIISLNSFIKDQKQSIMRIQMFVGHYDIINRKTKKTIPCFLNRTQKTQQYVAQ